MITICRAEDGQVVQVNASVRDIEGTGSLEIFLQQEIGVEPEAALAFLSDGRRLTTANIRDLGGTKDQYIFVFNQDYLESDIDDVAKGLSIEPPLQPTIEDITSTTPPVRPAALATSYIRTAQLHHEHMQQIFHSISLQRQALQIASSNLDYHVLQVHETFDEFAVNARKELEKQSSLLEGLEADLELISRVGVHVEFCSTAVRLAIEAGDPQRVLADYVSKQKMRQVADTCTRTHDDLQSRFNQVEQAVDRLKEGANSVRATLANANLFDEANNCSRRSQDLLDRIMDASTSLESPASDSEVLLRGQESALRDQMNVSAKLTTDLKHLDETHRHELQEVTYKKNLYTHQCVTILRHIAALNNDVVHIPPALSALVVSFRGKTSFSHIQRLHSMLYAYGATIIEIVRRKEFSRFYYHRAQSILEVMAKVSANERKRRQVYRGDVHGQLPFETKGMDDAVPTIDFSPTGGTDFVYSFERADVDALFKVLDDLENYSLSSSNEISLKTVRECRGSLEKLVTKMDNLEIGFDKIAERSLLSRSHISQSRRRVADAEEKMIFKMAEELRAVQEAKAQQEVLFQEGRSSLQAEIRQLSANTTELDSALSLEREKSARLERELQQVRAQMESEAVARRILEERNSELTRDLSKQRNEIARALGDATEQAREADMVRQELAQVRDEFDEVKQLEKRNADIISNLMEEQAKNLLHLEETRARGEDLESQIQRVRTESGQLHQALKEASQEKDRLLKDQAFEHDRKLRDHIAEADGDRAVLDRQFSELQAVLEHNERQLRDLRGDLEVSNADAVGLRQELRRVEFELQKSRQAEQLLRDDLKAGQASQHDFEHKMEDSSRLIAQILEVAINFRNTHLKALQTAQSISSHPSATRHTSVNLAESTFSAHGFRHHSLIGQPDEPSPIDPSDPSAALDLLRELDHDLFLEAISKTGSTVRKWQKQCKEYRERAKGKISFRNFAKGDLALFLPTRNSVSKPWAAFNVSFPHYFLQATGHLAEQLKTREWIVARITSITERVVDQKDPNSNPYGLGDGVKYYMLEVEDWTQPSHNKRKVSSRKVSASDNETKDFFPSGKLSPPALPPGPPEAEVEDTFLVTHPPNSHLFPVRPRSNSSPSARPSSLSRLLAQASPVPEGQIEDPSTLPPLVPEDHNGSPSPTTSPPPPPSPSLHTGSVPQSLNVNINNSNIPGLPSPLRPGSRASRLSTTSRFSIPVLGNVASTQSKAAPTTALTGQPVAVSPSSSNDNPFMSPVTPSPEDHFVPQAVVAVKQHRPRTLSYQAPRPSPLATSTSQSTVVPPRPLIAAPNTLVNLASTWGMSFGRKKKVDPVNSFSDTSNDGGDASESPKPDFPISSHSARDLLKRF